MSSFPIGVRQDSMQVIYMHAKLGVCRHGVAFLGRLSASSCCQRWSKQGHSFRPCCSFAIVQQTECHGHATSACCSPFAYSALIVHCLCLLPTAILPLQDTPWLLWRQRRLGPAAHVHAVWRPEEPSGFC